MKRVTLLMAALLLPATSLLALPDGDGWHRWSVAGLAGAKAGCCHQADRVSPCRLPQGDGQGHGYIADDSLATGGDVILYARSDSGRLVELLALSEQCPVEVGQVEVRDHGRLDADRSARWLGEQRQNGARLNDRIHHALALHAGAAADTLLRQAVEPGQQASDRRSALFWLGQTRAATAEALLLAALRDTDPKFRQHAAFVVSQTELASAFDALVSQGRSDKSARVRSQAWFWLAQQGKPAAEAALSSALTNESSRRVREQIVFALSQLPEARGSQALIALLQRPHADPELRKQALFWLAHSEDPAAWDYLETVLN